MEIDIRKNGTDKITQLRFADQCASGAIVGDVLQFYSGDCNVWVVNSFAGDMNEIMGVRNKKDAENLIKALKQAIELGWFD